MNTDDLDSIISKHEPVNVSEQMREAAGETPERQVPRPGKDHQVDRVVKRESRPAE